MPLYSWGFRDQTTGKMYIAIPGTLWAGGTTQTLTTYEQNVLNYFEQQTNNTHWGTTTITAIPTSSNPNPNPSWAAVLASLAHELGHVKFAYTTHLDHWGNATHHGKDFNFDFLTSCTTEAGGINFFDGWSYKNKNDLFPQDRNGNMHLWRDFANKNNLNGKPIDHNTAPLLSDFQGSNKPDTLLYELYSGTEPTYYGGWASFWGAWSPDEDFVETYVLYALSTNVNNLIILGITVDSNSYDIIQGATGKSTLAKKISCVANLPYLTKPTNQP
jgi:hypothetical protein